MCVCGWGVGCICKESVKFDIRHFKQMFVQLFTRISQPKEVTEVSHCEQENVLVLTR